MITRAFGLLVSLGLLAAFTACRKPCSPSKKCYSEGRCARYGKSLCRPSMDAHCRRSRACREEGRCYKGTMSTILGPVCVARSDADCRRSDNCKYKGRCKASDKLCRETAAGCRASYNCRTFGKCDQVRGTVAFWGTPCGPTRADHCRNSKWCRKEGFCHLVANWKWDPGMHTTHGYCTDLKTVVKLKLKAASVKDLASAMGLAKRAVLLLPSRGLDRRLARLLKHLRKLDLGGVAAPDLGALKPLKVLTHLDLSRAVVRDISPLYALKDLQWLNLTGATFNAAQLAAMRKKRPGLKVELRGKTRL